MKKNILYIYSPWKIDEFAFKYSIFCLIVFQIYAICSSTGYKKNNLAWTQCALSGWKI